MQAQAELDSAQVKLDNANQDLQRFSGLDVRARSQQQLDSASATQKKAQADLEQAQAKLQTTKSADAYRLIIWQDSVRLWLKRPVLGVGPGNFWPYDQIFTHLPVLLRNFNTTGLGVAHNGTLQTLGELGPLGVVFLYSTVVVVFVLAFRMYRRCQGPERRNDRILALICMGLVMGSIAGDFFSGSFFLPPRQIGSFQDLPQVLSSWVIFGCLFYRDKIWRQQHMYKEAVA